MDLILQKGVEIGVHSIAPVFAARTVVQLDHREKTDKMAKWQVQLIETLKQCGLPWLPKIEEPCTVAEGLANLSKTDLSFVATFDPQAQHPRSHIKRYLEIHQHPPKNVSLWIGPEGDFTPDEIQAMLSKGVLPITLGASVLRSETAAIYGLSCLHYELSWRHQRS
jgi:16S rRNA (uracil1498-N3)-methyltransferase